MLRSHSSKSVLAPGRLNVVGESHNQSDARRALEKEFVFEKTGSRNYWTEYEFPDMQTEVGIREKQDQNQEDGADLMEYRAAHGASLLVKESETLAAAARKLSGLKIGQLTPDKTVVFNKVVVKFDKSVDDFHQFANRVERSLTTTGTPEVNRIVEAIFQRVQNTCGQYASAARGTPTELQAAALSVANLLADLPKVLPALEKAAGVSSSGGTMTPLKDTMRTQRSSFMGLATVFSKEVGVWKVGNAHVDDLLSGRSKVDMSKANFVTKEAFNEEFDDWLSSRATK